MSDTDNKTKATSSWPLWILFFALLWLKVDPGDWTQTEVRGWSWWVITAPLWGPLTFAIVLLLIIGVVAAVLDYRDRKNRSKITTLRKNRNRFL